MFAFMILNSIAFTIMNRWDLVFSSVKCYLTLSDFTKALDLNPSPPKTAQQLILHNSPAAVCQLNNNAVGLCVADAIYQLNEEKGYKKFP